MTAYALTLLGAAGGGSGGFGGGGSGGGGGGGFGGGGSGGGSGDPGPWWLWVVIIVAVALFFAFNVMQARRYARRRLERIAQVELAAAEAREDDPDFDPETVQAAAAELFVAIQRHWTARDPDALDALAGPDLMVEWRRRLDDFARKGWHNVVEVKEGPDVEYVGLVNREGEGEDRVVVRVTAVLEDYVRDRDGEVVLKDDEEDTTVALEEWWTLQPPGDRWRLVSIEQEAEGRHHLDAPVVASPWADDRVRDEAIAERAAADAPVRAVAVAEIADPDLAGDARAAALDLSLVDGRFAPDVLEAAVRRATEAWAEAVDGDDAALEALATPDAVAALLYGGDASRRTRTVVRGARVEQVRIAALDGEAEPARMTVELRARGRRYVEDRDTTDVVAGSKDDERAFAMRWTFALDGADETPWRLVEAVD